MKAAKKDNHNTSSIEQEIEAIQNEQKQNKINKKAAETKLKNIYKIIEAETKSLVKEKFDYDVPIAKIDDAGITTTGAISVNNQLPALVQEYREYCEKSHLWDIKTNNISYKMNGDKYMRIKGSEEEVLND